MITQAIGKGMKHISHHIDTYYRMCSLTIECVLLLQKIT